MKKPLLTQEFLNNYKGIEPPFTDFGKFVYLRTYSRWLEEEQRREYWWETVARAVEFNCSILETSREEAEELFDNIFNLRQFLSGRTLFTGGTKASELYPLSNFNCAFTVMDNFTKFSEIIYLMSVGAGVGFRILKDDVAKLPKIRKANEINVVHKHYEPVAKGSRQEVTTTNLYGDILEIVVGDSKVGWSMVVDIFLEVFHSHKYRTINNIIVNYDNVRPEGERLKTFGGYASGHQAIQRALEKTYKVLCQVDETRKLRPIHVMDICNITAEGIVCGGVRRSAQICLFDADDQEVLTAKSQLYKQDENGVWSIDESISHRSLSNNSIYYSQKPTKDQINWQVDQMRFSGEPAFINGQAINKRRKNGNGCNPCGEILLDSDGVCNLTTVNLMAFTNENGELNMHDLSKALRLGARAAYRMAHLELELSDWNKVQERDRLVGCSFTGYQDMVNWTGINKYEEQELLDSMRQICRFACNEYAKQVDSIVPELITTIKPEGTLSCLPTVSSGIHYSHSPYYVRRVRITAVDPLAKLCEELGYPVFPEVGQDIETCSTKVIEFPIKSPTGKTKYDVSALEQLENYRMTMKHYTDHNTSITVSVREHEWDDVKEWMYENWDDVVGISFLSLDDSFYQLLPYEAISEEEYNERVANMKPLDQELLRKFEENKFEEKEEVADMECTNGVCAVR